MEQLIFKFLFMIESATEKVYKFYARTNKQASLEAPIPLWNGSQATATTALYGSTYPS